MQLRSETDMKDTSRVRLYSYEQTKTLLYFFLSNCSLLGLLISLFFYPRYKQRLYILFQQVFYKDLYKEASNFWHFFFHFFAVPHETVALKTCSHTLNLLSQNFWVSTKLISRGKRKKQKHIEKKLNLSFL